MKTKHTPGPWFYVEETNNIENGNSVICTFYDEQETDIAVDARLIAAAPEMLEALEEALAILKASDPRNVELEGRYSDVMLEVEDAIRKAKGGKHENIK